MNCQVARLPFFRRDDLNHPGFHAKFIDPTNKGLEIAKLVHCLRQRPFPQKSAGITFIKTGPNSKASPRPGIHSLSRTLTGGLGYLMTSGKSLTGLNTGILPPP